MKNLKNLGKTLSKSEQKMISGYGAGGLYCCEWCPDGSCNDWVDNPRTQCPYAPAC